MSRFTGLQFTGLLCLPVFFFRATPSPRFTGGMPVYRGGSCFHACGAPPAAAHSHTRCCTQHNTTHWVLRAAANTCPHTMPCAAGELCQLSDSTTTPEFSCWGHAEVACTAFAVILMTTRKSTASANHALQQRSLPAVPMTTRMRPSVKREGVFYNKAHRKNEKARPASGHIEVCGDTSALLVHVRAFSPVYRHVPVYRFTGLPCLPVLFGLATTGR